MRRQVLIRNDKEIKKWPTTLKVVPEMQSLQKPATTFMMKNGIQQRRKTPIIIPMVIAACKKLSIF